MFTSETGRLSTVLREAIKNKLIFDGPKKATENLIYLYKDNHYQLFNIILLKYKLSTSSTNLYHPHAIGLSFATSSYIV
jgi:hypothetical protein